MHHDYNKLRTKERRSQHHRQPQAPRPTEKEEYPEHLRHLYLAENAKLKQEELANRSKRSLARRGGQVKKAEPEDRDRVDDAEVRRPVPSAETAAAAAARADAVAVPDRLEEAQVDPEPSKVLATETEREDTSEPAEPSQPSVPMSNRMKKKLTRKTTYEMAQEEFQEVKEKRRKKNEEFQVNKKQKEEAMQKYQNKKKAAFQILNKKTRKGQPNLNLQMEYLLQKIQGPRK